MGTVKPQKAEVASVLYALRNAGRSGSGEPSGSIFKGILRFRTILDVRYSGGLKSFNAIGRVSGMSKSPFRGTWRPGPVR